MVKIGIIGAGNVGGALGARWAHNGHKVTFTSRNPQSPEMKALLSEAGENARASGPRSLAAASEVLVLAVPWPAAKDAVKSLGDVRGKILIDATDPVLPDLSGLALGTTTSAGEQVSEWAAGAKVVKAFNTVGSNIMANAKFGAAHPVLFYCGGDMEAKSVVAGLAKELGFDARDAGPLTQARLLEPFALLWISLAFAQGYGREIAFQFMQHELTSSS